jgi:signal transduction histidine kinase
MISIIIYIVTIIINLFLGLLVYVKNPSKSQNKEFALLTASVTGWISTLFIYYTISDPAMVLFVGRLNFAIAIFISFFFYRFVYVFPNKNLILPSWLVKFIMIFTIVIGIMTFFTPYVDKQELVRGADRENVFGELAILYVINTLFNFSFGVILMIIKLKRSAGVEKLQLQYLLIGFVLQISIGALANLLFPFFLHSFALVPFGPLGTIFFLGFISYSMVKHRLLQVRRIIIRPFIYIILLGFGTFLYSISIFWITRSFFDKTIAFSETILFESLAIVIILTIIPFRAVLNKVTDKIFFKTKYSSDYLLSDLSTVITNTLDLEKLTKDSLNELLGVMRIRGGAFIVKKDRKAYSLACIGVAKDDKYLQQVLAYAENTKQIVVAEEIEDENSRRKLNDLGIDVLLPLSVGDNLHGYLILTEKKSGEIYSNQDITLLQIFGPEVAVAIQNAKAYEEIKQFNVTLQEEIKKATIDLQKANVHLKELDKLKDEFLSLASHELRTPIGIIKNYLWIVLEKDKSLSEDTKTKLEHAFSSSESMILLINDMLNVSRIEGNRINLVPVEIDMAQFIGKIGEDMNSLAENKGISLNMSLGKNLVVKADADRVREVMINLIGNATKFTPENGKITVNLRKVDKTAQIDIIDNGIGIRKEDLPKLFTKFGRLENLSAVAKIPGSGLGLYISKKLVQLCGGKIWVNSEFNKGSTFSFTLPLA